MKLVACARLGWLLGLLAPTSMGVGFYYGARWAQVPTPEPGIFRLVNEDRTTALEFVVPVAGGIELPLKSLCP